MGKSLIIKGGNFAANAITNLSDWTDITENMLMSSTKRQYIHYPNGSLNDVFQYDTSALNTTSICSIDVSAYVGRRIRVYWAQQRPASNYTGGCYWRCFASALKSGITLPWSGTTVVQNAITAVERISGTTPTGTTMAAEYSVLTVPTGAVYLIFSNDSNRCPIPKVWIENV